VQPALDDLDLFGPSFQDDPPAVYEQLRRSGAVHYLPRHGWYLVTRAETAREVLRDSALFSSRVHKHTQPPPEVAGQGRRRDPGSLERLSDR
jgi:cytochrome P450